MSHGGLGIEHLDDVEPLGPDADDQVFAATDRKLDRRVRVRLLPHVAGDEERDRFLDRARALAGLSSHRNIVTVYDAGLSSDDRPYVVTELVEGPTLANRVTADGQMPWTEAADLALELAAGLEQVHQAGGRHRDLRPENILVTGSIPTLTDVGLLPEPAPTSDSPVTLAHRAPETMSGDGDERSDLYALTSILYLAIDGRGPYWRPDDTVEAIRARRLTQSAPVLDPELVPPALAVFIAAGLSTDPLDRPQDVGEFSGELRLIAEGRVTGSTPSILHAPAGRPTSGPVPVVVIDPFPSAGQAPVDVGASAIDPAVVATPSWAFDTAELTATDGRQLTPAGSWAPPTSHEAYGWSEPVALGPATTTVDVDPPAVEPRPLIFEPEPAPFEPFEPYDVPPFPDDQTTLIPTFAPAPGPNDGPSRPPLVIVAGAMIAIGLVGLFAVLAVGLRVTGSDGEAPAPVLADPDAPTEAETGSAVEGAPTTLTPLAMLPESTTTTDPDAIVTSTDTTIRRVAVPNLVSLEVAVAGQRLSDLGFEVLVVGRVSPGSLPGTVIQQTPAAGSTIELPATVTLFIPRSATLPSMVGRPADTVCLQLTALGLRCQQTLRFDERVAPGAVIATDPIEGSAFTEGQTIRIDVSRGPLTEARVPPVTGLSEDEARTALGGAGFVALTTATVASDNVPAGQAIGTVPAAGTSLAIDQAITIQISSGPAPTVTVPDLIGLDRAAAEAALQRVQLTGSFVLQDLPAGDPNIGRVLAADPRAATQLPAGSTVTVTVGQAPAATTTTTAATAGSTSTASGGG